MAEEILAQRIASLNKRNAITFTCGGAILCLITLLLHTNGSLSIVAFLPLVPGLVLLVLGVSKLFEPKYALTLSCTGLTYFHRRGQFFINWQDIQRIDFVRITQGFELITLPFIGIKLKCLSPLLKNISPRLASGLLTEQRALFVESCPQIEMMENQLSQEFTELHLNDESQQFRGLKAMFGHRCQWLNKQLGYHIYIPIESLNQSPDELLKLLCEYQRQAVI